MNIGASQHPIRAAKRQKRRKHAVVDMRVILAGSTHAMTSIAISMPQNTSWLPKKNCMADTLLATPRAQKAEISRPTNMRT